MTNKYKNSKNYKIWSTKGNNIYIGSTTYPQLCMRMSKHRECYKQWIKGNKNYTSSFILFDEYGINNCFIELIEAKECTNKDELLKLEGKHIRELKCVNLRTPAKTQEENLNERRLTYYKLHCDKPKQENKENKEVYSLSDINNILNVLGFKLFENITIAREEFIKKWLMTISFHKIFNKVKDIIINTKQFLGFFNTLLKTYKLKIQSNQIRVKREDLEKEGKTRDTTYNLIFLKNYETIQELEQYKPK